jgi:hypothetical protein
MHSSVDVESEIATLQGYMLQSSIEREARPPRGFGIRRCLIRGGWNIPVVEEWGAKLLDIIKISTHASQKEKT